MANTYPYNPYRQQASVGIPYQPMYDPSFDQQTAQLMSREGMRSRQALAGVQAQQAASGDIYSEDLVGKQRRLDEFKQSTDAIKEKFGHDLALAAPALSQAIIEERSNPWYQKNALYNKESVRKQQLQDKYGINLITTQDLPQGDLTDVAMEDIKYQAINRMHLHQIWGEDFDEVGKQIRTSDLAVDKNYPSILTRTTTKGVTEGERQDIVAGYIPMLDKMIKQQGYPDTPEIRDMLFNEFDNWSKGLVGGSSMNDMANREWSAQKATGASRGGGAFLPTNDTVVSQTAVDPATGDIETINAAKTGVPVPEEVFGDSAEYAAILDKEPLVTFDDSLFTFIPENYHEEVLNLINTKLRGDFVGVKRLLRNTDMSYPADNIVDTLIADYGAEFSTRKERMQVKKLLDNKFNAHSEWTTNEYKPIEKDFLENRKEFMLNTSVAIPTEPKTITALNAFASNQLGAVPAEELMYYDENMRRIDKKNDTFRRLDTLIKDEGYEVKKVAIIEGTYRSPNIYQITLKNSKKTEIIRVAPNEANSGIIDQELASIMQNPTYLYASRSNELWKQAENKKLSLGTILGDPDISTDNYIKQLENNGFKYFAVVDKNGTPVDHRLTDVNVARLADNWVLSLKDEEIINSYLPRTIASQFYLGVFGDNLTPTEIKEYAIGYLSQQTR